MNTPEINWSWTDYRNAITAEENELRYEIYIAEERNTLDNEYLRNGSSRDLSCAKCVADIFHSRGKNVQVRKSTTGECVVWLLQPISNS